ncbi:hypothetical protein JLBYU31_9 [Escherichia phage JLBYU31]|nr:hypothetical protein JLBYU31_9 [Escherichia phage JLBYU31]
MVSFHLKNFFTKRFTYHKDRGTITLSTTEERKMKFKFYYAKHKITDEFVSVEYSSDDEGMIYTRLGLSHWESDTPYFSTPEEITRLINGHMNDHWNVILSDSLKAAINSNEMKIAEIEL